MRLFRGEYGITGFGMLCTIVGIMAVFIGGIFWFALKADQHNCHVEATMYKTTSEYKFGQCYLMNNGQWVRDDQFRSVR